MAFWALRLTGERGESRRLYVFPCMAFAPLQWWSRLKRHPWEPIPLTSRLLCFNATSAAATARALAHTHMSRFWCGRVQIYSRRLNSCRLFAKIHHVEWLARSINCFANGKCECVLLYSVFGFQGNARRFVCPNGKSPAQARAGNQFKIQQCLTYQMLSK